MVVKRVVFLVVVFVVLIVPHLGVVHHVLVPPYGVLHCSLSLILVVRVLVVGALGVLIHVLCAVVLFAPIVLIHVPIALFGGVVVVLVSVVVLIVLIDAVAVVLLVVVPIDVVAFVGGGVVALILLIDVVALVVGVLLPSSCYYNYLLPLWFPVVKETPVYLRPLFLSLFPFPFLASGEMIKFHRLRYCRCCWCCWCFFLPLLVALSLSVASSTPCSLSSSTLSL